MEGTTMYRQLESETSVPVLCRFWFEDGVWNGIAADAPIAAFGSTVEEAMGNLREAIETHVLAAIETGQIASLINHLQERARDYGFLRLEEISPSSPIVKMNVALKNQELVAVT
jgi:predicted RNase H-like HicB family nuclease